MVVRRVLRGLSGPSGGPALTDLLGVMESWGAGVTTVRSESGQVSAIAIADIVSGKPVPPRPSVRHRISPEQAERRALAGWPPLVVLPLGDWLMRASQGYSARANSALAVGDPGMSFESAAAAVRSFYADHRLPAWAQLVVGSQLQSEFELAGWLPARPGEEDTLFQIASVSQALRAARAAMPSVVPEVSMSATADAAWLAAEDHPPAPVAAAVGVLEGPDEVAFVSVRSGQVIAKGRAACADDWLGVTNLWVSPDSRRQGLAIVVVGALLEWGAERGATTAYLQTRGGNPGALSLYERLGFRTHHSYRYLTPR